MHLIIGSISVRMIPKAPNEKPLCDDYAVQLGCNHHSIPATIHSWLASEFKMPDGIKEAHVDGFTVHAVGDQNGDAFQPNPKCTSCHGTGVVRGGGLLPNVACGCWRAR